MNEPKDWRSIAITIAVLAGFQQVLILLLVKGLHDYRRYWRESSEKWSGLTKNLMAMLEYERRRRDVGQQHSISRDAKSRPAQW
jgi:hypothetical protein